MSVSRCLIANDSEFLLVVFQETLQKHFDVVDAVENGLQAVQAVQRQHPNYYSAIVLDISMPIMDGVEACLKIQDYFDKQDQQQLPAPDRISSQFTFQRRRASVMSVALQQQAPYIYALTSECEESVIRRIRRAGFKEVFHALDQSVLKQILSNAGLPYKLQRSANQK